MANPYFNAEYYLSQNPDLFAAGINTAEGAWEHYVNFGAAEALNGATTRKPAPWFDTSYYLAQNTDLITAGLTAGQLFDHFTNFGIDEGRKPSVDAVLSAESLLAYAKANEDLMEAFDIEADATELTEDQVKALSHQFYAFGYKEDRADPPFDIIEDDPAAGGTFTLTVGAGAANADYADTSGFMLNGSPFSTAGFKFTSANEIVNASTASLQAFDMLIDGSTTDSDTLNVAANATVAAGAGNQFTATNIENLNFNFSGGLATYDIDLANVSGAKTLKLAGTTSAATAITINDGGAGTPLIGTGITTLDASGLTTAGGSMTVAFGGTSTAALTVKGHNGADNITTGGGNDNISGGGGNDTINAGSGNDTIRGGAGNDNLTGGAGQDTFVFEATAALNGSDTITDFAVAQDKLAFSAFLPDGTVNVNGGENGAIVAFSTGAGARPADTSDVNITGQVALLDISADPTAAGAGAAAVLAQIQGAGNAFSLTAGGKAIVAVGDESGATNPVEIYYIDDNLDGATGSVTAADIVLVATTNNLDLDSFTTANFVFA